MLLSIGKVEERGEGGGGGDDEGGFLTHFVLLLLLTASAYLNRLLDDQCL